MKNSYYKDEGKRLLKYIYQDVYYNKFELKIEKAKEVALEGSLRYENLVNPIRCLKNNMSLFLDGDESIITYFDEMIEDDISFISTFFTKVNTYFDMIDNHFYDSDDFEVISFTFNIYAMLKAYHEHKDNFELYKKILTDCTFLIDCKNLSSFFEMLPIKKKLIDKAISSKWYIDVDYPRECLEQCLQNIANFDSFYVEDNVNCLLYFFELMDGIFEGMMDLRKENPDYNLVSLDILVNSFLESAISGFDDNKTVYYCKSLLFGERFRYLNDNISRYIVNADLRKSFVQKLSSVDYHFFEYLNCIGSSFDDSFINFIDIVFDSDSYYEVESKLNLLIEAGNAYNEKEFDKVLEIVKDLSSLKHKKVVDDKMVNYQSRAINQIDKVNSITERMINAYKFIYPDLNMRNLIVSLDNLEFDSFETYDILLNSKINDFVTTDKKVNQEIENSDKQKTDGGGSGVKLTEFRENLEVKEDVSDSVSLNEKDFIETKALQKIKVFFGKKK